MPGELQGRPPSERRARWVLLFVVAVVVAAVCVRLGFWQLDRLEQRRALNARLAAALASEPVPLDELLASGDPTYRRVTATGTWDATHEVILYGRALEGRPGNHVLTPLRMPDGRAVLVDRGWVPTEVASTPVTGDAAAPSGDVVVEGIVLPSDEAEASPSEDLPAQVRHVDVAALDAAIPSDLVQDVYVLLEGQSPAQERPIPAPLPELGEGPHLSYAIQWFAFAAIAVVGYVLLARKARRGTAAPESAAERGGT